MNPRILIFLCLTVTCTAIADVVDDVRDHEIRFSQSVEKQDLEQFTSLIDEDARFVSDVVSRGPAAVADAWSAFFAKDGPRIKWRPRVVEVLEDGTLALSRGPYKMTVTDEDGSFELTGLDAGEYKVEIWHETLGDTDATITIKADGSADPLQVKMGAKKKKKGRRR